LDPIEYYPGMYSLSISTLPKSPVEVDSPLAQGVHPAVHRAVDIITGEHQCSPSAHQEVAGHFGYELVWELRKFDPISDFLGL